MGLRLPMRARAPHGPCHDRTNANWVPKKRGPTPLFRGIGQRGTMIEMLYWPCRGSPARREPYRLE